jgi:N-acetyl sugar amidotransferase
VPNINFDSEGICNYCKSYFNSPKQVFDVELQKRNFDELITKVKRNGKGKPYDCIVGLSGGVDSSYAIVRAVEAGLRPLAVHMDNGWNSELAQNNIANLVRILKVDLHTHVIDWTEYRELMQAFFDADVIDVELLYDNAMLAVNYKQASKFGLRYILAGYNKATEGMPLPESWSWNKYDKLNIRDIAKNHGNVKIKTFPAVGSWAFAYYNYIKLISFVPFLDYFPYNKYEALDLLENNFGYKRYPYKHYESIFTRFYQGYILPKKFGVDKRKIHLSNLVVSGQLSREQALEDIKGIPYPNEEALNSDIEYFLKKMKWTSEMLESYISRPEVSHNKYASERKLFNKVVNVRDKLPKGFSNAIVKWVKKNR